MPESGRYMVDVGMQKLPFPIKVISRSEPEGQHTVANISVRARIMQEFEAQWIDKFIQIIQQHRDNIGSVSLNKNIVLMDEPTSSLDDVSIKLLIKFVRSLKGKTIVSASHNHLWVNNTDKVIHL